MVDTIFAQASARGQAGVAVVRISGALALTAAAALAGGAVPARRAVLRWLRDPDSGERIDQAVVLAFPAPGSFTGEDVAELQVHGSQAVVRALLAVLGRMPGLRSAEPGEFTRRALINERLDLAQVEGLADLLAAETAAQRRQALALMDGALSRKAAEWRRRLIEALAFGDEIHRHVGARGRVVIQNAQDRAALQAQDGAAGSAAQREVYRLGDFDIRIVDDGHGECLVRCIAVVERERARRCGEVGALRGRAAGASIST